MSFDFQPVLTSDTITLRPLQAWDQPGLRSAAADPLIWEMHPARTRHLPGVFDPYFSFLLGTGTTLAITQTRGGRIVGCSRFYLAPDQPDAISIGFTFLARDHWGGSTNREIKRLMVAHVFAAGKDVWLHIDPANLRSQKATAKLGARHVYDARLDLGAGPADYMCFRLTPADWASANLGTAPRV